MQNSGDFDYSVFFGDMNLHVPVEYSHPRDLRARILLHVLLSEPLIIADSHSLNSTMFRQLVVARDAPPFVTADLGELLRRGDLRVARRDIMDSFQAIRANHQKRKIDHVPAPGYARWLDEVTDGHVIEYSADVVSANFKRGFTTRIDKQLANTAPGTPPLYTQTLEMMRDWAAAEDVVLYKRIREVYEDWRKQEKNSATETEEAVAFIERSASSSYHLGVPQAIALAVSGPRNDELVELPTSIRPTGELSLPYGLVNPTVWQNIPIDGVIEILGLKSRQDMLAAQAAARKAGMAKVDRLMDSTVTFADEVDAILHRVFVAGRDGHDEVLAAMRRAARRARVTALIDESNGATGIRIHGGDDTPADTFDVLSMPVAVTETRLWVEQDDETKTPNNRVVTGTDITPGGPAMPRAA
jgi:hypothetical protein